MISNQNKSQKNEKRNSEKISSSQRKTNFFTPDAEGINKGGNRMSLKKFKIFF
jgi:hypothetical protein